MGRTAWTMIELTRVSFGSTSAIVTSMGLIVGLDVATASRRALVSSLLIVALADNISDSLSIHVYQESERLESRAAFRATLTNFVARLLVALTFVGLAVWLPQWALAPASLGWGLLLLGGLSAQLARDRGVGVGGEIGKHLGVAVAVIVVSREVASMIAAYVR
jgi:vacuolar iron transporter family protein